MYTVPLKSAIVEAIRATFTDSYPNPDFRNLWSSIEFPTAPANYPGIWVTWDDTEEVAVAGIGHIEVSEDGQVVTRARFGGVLTLTVVAMSSLERDRLYDELLRVLMFAHQDPSPVVESFRYRIENNDLVAMNANFDKVKPSGDSAAPGTPWGSEEFIYERSLSVDVIGEFVSNGVELVPLSQIHAQGYALGSPMPLFPDNPPNDPPTPVAPGWADTHFEATTPREEGTTELPELGGGGRFDPTAWH
jgi:hypothetical protein